MRMFLMSLFLSKEQILGILLEDFYRNGTPESKERLEAFIRKNQVTVESVPNGVRFSM